MKYTDIVLSGVIVLVAYKAFKYSSVVEETIGGLVDDAKKFYGGETILEPGAELSESSEQQKQRYIESGYLAVDDMGNTYITEAGEQYISEQQESKSDPIDSQYIDYDILL